MCFGLFMVMLDNTVVNLALPSIHRQLGSGLSGLQWIVDAFTLLLASLMLTGGTLGDLYGRKRAFISGLVVFTAGSLLCALSPTIQIPIGLIAFGIAIKLVPESKNPEGRSLDIMGQVLAVAGLAALTYAFIEANT